MPESPIILFNAALSVTSPAHAPIAVSLLIDGYLYARRRHTVRHQTPDFNPNILVNRESCREKSQRIAKPTEQPHPQQSCIAC